MRKWILLASLVVLGLLCLFSGTLFPETPVDEKSIPEFSSADIAWMLVSSAMVLIMTPGLGFFYGGMVRKKNVISTILQSFIAMGVITVVWVVIGFGLAFGDSIGGIIGNPSKFLFFSNVGTKSAWSLAPTIPLILFAVFQMKFAIITPALISGAFAERIRFWGYLLFIILFSLFIYSPLAHAVWHPDGILFKYGVLDFAGGTVVHMSAGWAALAGALFLKKRTEIIHDPSRISYVILGTALLWFGWFGFNAGSALSANATAAMAFGTTTIASGTAMLSWIFFDRVNGRKVSALGACIGAVVGLVAITPAAGFVTIPHAIFIGFISAIVSNLMCNWKRLKKVDDTLDVFACHGVGGIMGMILTAILAQGENASLLHGGFEVFAHHMMALVLVSAFTFLGSLVLYKLTDIIIPLRVAEDSENIGLDLSQHDETCI